MDLYGKSLNGSPDNLVVNIPPIEYKYLLKNYSFLLQFPKDIKILEIGPGIGYFTQFLLHNGYENIDIVELSLDFFTSQKRAFGDYKNINFYNNDIIDFLKCEDTKYDIIISRQVIEHLNGKSLLNYFSLAFSHLNNGGKLISETINSQNFVYSSFLRYIDITHKISFSSDMIKQVFNTISSKEDNMIIGGIKQLNTIDYIYDKFSKFDYRLNLHIGNQNSNIQVIQKTKLLKIADLFFSFISQMFRDFARFSSELLSLFFFQNRAYKNIGTEFILFIFEKGVK